MKITASQLRQIIKEEVSKSLLESAHVPTALEVIERYKNNPRAWTMAQPEFEDMAYGGDGGGVRDQFYLGWKDQDFIRVLTVMEQLS